MVAKRKFKHDPNYDYPRAEDTKDLKFLAICVIAFLVTLLGTVLAVSTCF